MLFFIILSFFVVIFCMFYSIKVIQITHEGKKIQFVTALDLIKCLTLIKLQILLLTCAPISELPSNINTVERPVILRKTEMQT